MSVERPETIAGRDVVFLELTLDEIRHWLAGVAAADPAALPEPSDLADSLLFPDFDIQDVLQMTRLQKADMGEMTPAQIEAVHARCKAINSRFFSMRDHLAEVGRQAQMISPPNS